jgi:transcriptional regulator with XRE-family HTH domain
MSRRNRWDELRQDRLAAPAASAGYERARRAFELGEQLRALREAQRLSQSELARRMGSTQPAIARLEAGRVAPSLDTLDRAAAALGVELVVTLGSLLADVPHTRPSPVTMSGLISASEASVSQKQR